MNPQNLLMQIRNATNPMQMMMGMLNPSQNQMTEQFKTQSKQQQAEQIANLCNQKGITKDDLINIINGLKGK